MGEQQQFFERVVDQIFNNWTALKLAVEHSLGGPNSRQAALDAKNYMVDYCLNEQNVDVLDIQDILEDIMDEDFDTICEDDSPKEVAQYLFKFLQIVRGGNAAQYEEEFNKLPKMNPDWLVQSKMQETPSINESLEEAATQEVSTTSNAPTPMEQDSEWTEVKTRRKK